jgi:hypothetical protein
MSHDSKFNHLSQHLHRIADGSAVGEWLHLDWHSQP